MLGEDAQTENYGFTVLGKNNQVKEQTETTTRTRISYCL
jgi:hypothetical protein